MPIHEYKCAECGHVTETLTRSDSDEEPACEECGGEDLEKLFSAFSARVVQSAEPSRCEGCPNGSCPMH